MNLKMIQAIRLMAIACVCVTMACCHTTKGSASDNATVQDEQLEYGTMQVNPTKGGTPSASMIPKAVIYKTNGDYNDLVPVTLNADGTKLISYPAPTDLSENSTPVTLKDGWLLDRRGGIGTNTAFLKYTYKEYMQLSNVAPAEIMKWIVPDAHVTEVKQLPVTINEAMADPQSLNKYIE